MKSAIFLFFCIYFLMQKISCLAENFPSDIQRCKYGDTDCIRSSSNDIIRRYPHGYPALKLPDLDPFLIKEFKLTQGGNSLALNLTISDCEFSGLSNATMTSLTGFEKDFLKSKFEMVIDVPKLLNKAKYKISGRLLLLPIEGNGEAFFAIKNVKISLKLKPKLDRIVDGKRYLKIDKYKVKLDVEHMQIRMTNLFNGDKLLGDNMNKIMNENWKVLWEEFSPSIARIAADFTKDIINDMYNTFAYEDCFLNE